MELEEFASCCGAVLLHDLFMPESLDDNNQLVADQAKFDKQLKNIIQGAKQAKYGFVEVITNPAQANLEQSLRNAGFLLRFEAVNPLHGTVLKVWFLDMTNIPDPILKLDPYVARESLRVTMQGQPEDANDWYDIGYDGVSEI